MLYYVVHSAIWHDVTCGFANNHNNRSILLTLTYCCQYLCPLSRCCDVVLKWSIDADKLPLAYIQIVVIVIEYWLLLDNSMSYTSIYKYVWNAKWHLWACSDNYWSNECLGESINTYCWMEINIRIWTKYMASYVHQILGVTQGKYITIVNRQKRLFESVAIHLLVNFSLT